MVKCLGIKRLDFTDDNGKQIQGYTFWFSDTDASVGWYGSEVYKKFLNDAAVKDLGIDLMGLPGHDVKVEYGRKDRITSIEIVK